MSRVGVFLYSSPEEMGEGFQAEQIAEVLKKEVAEVVYAGVHPRLLSEEGLRMVREKIQSEHLNRVVIGATSPQRYLKAFRKAAEEAGLNPYLLSMVNLREELSWVHTHNPEGAMLKTIEVLTKAVKRILFAEPLKVRRIRGEKRILVIGGGAAGIHLSLLAANAGLDVILVEKQPTIGGITPLLARLYPSMEDAEDELVPRMMEVSQRPEIKLYDYSEVEKVTGFLGSFDVTIRKKARLVNAEVTPDFTRGISACPVEVPDEYNAGLTRRKALFIPHPQAVPRLPVIDRKNCLRYKGEDCRLCQQAMPPGAVDYEQKDTVVHERVGAVIVATGAGYFEPSAYSHYHYGDYPDVLLSFQMERLLKRKGLVKEPLCRLSDNQPVKSVVFLQDVGGEDTQRGIPYATELPEMITAKQGILVKEIDPSIEVYVFYPERRSHTKGYGEFVRTAELKYGIKYIRGKASEVRQENGRLRVTAQNTILGEAVEVLADLVVLSTDMVPSEDAEQIAHMLGVRRDERGFFEEAHPAFRPIHSPQEGIYFVGAALGPSDLREVHTQAEGVLGAFLSDLPEEGRVAEPYLAVLTDVDHCTGCFDCGRVCPYHAIELVMKPGSPRRKIAHIIENFCTGCGLCIPACTPKVLDLKGQNWKQIYAEAEVTWA